MFVSPGLGSVVATSIEVAPWLIPISRHKTLVFAAVGALLALNYWLAIARPRQMDCAPGEICHVDSPAMRVNRILFWASVTIWTGSVVFAYAAPWWMHVRS